MVKVLGNILVGPITVFVALDLSLVCDQSIMIEYSYFLLIISIASCRAINDEDLQMLTAFVSEQDGNELAADDWDDVEVQQSSDDNDEPTSRALKRVR